MGNLRSSVKNFTSKARWDEPLKNETFGIPEGRPTRIRLYSQTETVPQHYVEFFSDKKQQKTGFYALCCNWNYDTGEPEDRGCPACAADIRMTSYVYGYCISRADQKKTGVTNPRVIRLTGKAAADIVKLTDVVYPDGEYPEDYVSPDGGGPDATDLKYGFDFAISMERNNSKTEYKVSAIDGGKKPLTKEEVKALRVYADQFPIGSMAKAGQQTVDELRASLQRVGAIPGSEKPRGSASEKAKAKSASSSYTDYDDSVPEDGEDDATPRKKASSQKTVVRQSLTDDDDDETDTPPARPAPAKAKSSYSWDDDEEEGEDEASGNVTRTYAHASAEDAPDDDDDE